MDKKELKEALREMEEEDRAEAKRIKENKKVNDMIVGLCVSIALAIGIGGCIAMNPDRGAEYQYYGCRGESAFKELDCTHRRRIR